MTHLSRRALGATAVLTATVLATATTPAQAGSNDRARHTAKVPTSVGFGGAVTTVDPEASAAALKVLKQGGNATDAAVAAAATLGVTEPYSSGIGGGGYFVYYDARTGKVQHHRRPRDRARLDAARRLHRPGHRQALQLHPGAGHQRRLGRRARQPRDLAARARPLGHHVARPHLPPGRARRPPRLRGRPDVPPADAGEQGAVRRLPVQPAGCSCPAATRRRSARSSATPPSPRRTSGSRTAASPSCTTARSAARSADVVHHPPKTASTTLPVPTGFMEPSRPARLPDHRPPADPRRLPRVRRLRHGAVVVRRLDRRRGAQHHGALRPGRHDHRRRAAPLPRRQRPGLRRPRRLRRRPGVRRRSPAGAALRPVRRSSGPARSATRPR